ncbi:MAG: SPOR domain-containing protein [Flavobacteriales bacterium]|nr:SPOR domain-containing protein [Flavobacteriales bacterium]MCB9166818.1 SPOR domain-containing protein [Flavobacteriales bacterium]
MSSGNLFRTVLLGGLLTGLPCSAQPPVRLFEPYHPKSDPPPQDTAKEGTTVPGMVVLKGEERVLDFVADYPNLEHVVDGFRVQIFLGSKPDAMRMRATFMQQHPDMPAYLSYLAPNFRVRVGDLPDRLSAERLRQQLRADFPGCYIVPDQVKPSLRPLDR